MPAPVSRHGTGAGWLGSTTGDPSWDESRAAGARSQQINTRIADRLVAITSTTGLAWSAKYDGDGVRLGQVVNGVPITYTLDLAAPLVTVLAEAQLNKRITYLYGLGDSPLAGDDGAAWVYLSGRDALNSVRQETDAAGQVLATRSFDPYGVVLSGDGGTPFWYAGEYRDKDMIAYRAEGLSKGRWPGTVKPDSAASAERLYNLAETSGNDMVTVSTYRIPAGTTIYEGWVEGGSGWQVYVPNARQALQVLQTEPLPQYGY